MLTFESQYTVTHGHRHSEGMARAQCGENTTKNTNSNLILGANSLPYDVSRDRAHTDPFAPDHMHRLAA